jgi:hypothetical protein
MTCPCGQQIHGATLCAHCTTTLEHAITNINAHWQDLDNVRAKLTRYGGQGGPHGDHLPIDPRFAQYAWIQVNGEYTCTIPAGTALIDAVRNTITTWVRVVHDRWPVVTGPTCPLPCPHATCAIIRRSRPPADKISSCCNYLIRYVDRMRVAEWGPDILDELTHLEHQLRQFVDRPGDKWYAGPCDTCRRDLYARTGSPTVDCSECQLTYDVPARRTWLLEQAEDQLVNAATLSRAISWLGGQPLTEQRVRQWGHRGRITVKGHEPTGRPLYRVGDALDLLATETQKAG